MGDAVLLLTATLALGGFQSAGFASNHQVGVLWGAGMCVCVGGVFAVSRRA